MQSRKPLHQCPLPKNNVFPSNVHGHLSSTIHRLNNGITGSAEKKLDRMGVHLSEKATYSLQQMQKEETVKHTSLSKGRQLQEHLQYKKTHSTKSDYRKGQLDPTPSTSRGDNHDHSYSKEY